MFSKIFNTIYRFKEDENALLFWQKKIFKHLFAFLILLGCIPYVLSCKYAVENSEWHRVIFYSLIYLWAIAIAFLEKLPFSIRIWAGISGFYILGIFSMCNTGIVGSTRLYLLCFSAFAAIFSGLRAGIITLLINMLTLAVSGYIVFHSPNFSDPAYWPQDPMTWVVISGTFCFLTAAVTITLSVLIKALEISGYEFKHLIENTSDIIWTLDKDLSISYINSSVNSILGFSQKEMIGTSLSDLLDPSDGMLFMNQMTEQNSFVAQTSILHKDGHFIDVEINGSRISHSTGNRNIFQGQIRDISIKKKQLELQEKLAQSEKLKSLGILAGSVAHDLNNILSGIATYPEILMMDKTLDPKIHQGLELIKDSGQKASAVVSDLLTVSRGASTEMEILNLNTIIKRYCAAHDFQKIQDNFKQVSIEIETEPELLNILGSYIHIEKLMMNLVINAVEEVSNKPDGQVIITTANAYIDTALTGYDNVKEGEYVILKVTDNGNGIKKEHIKNIFDPFFTKKEMGKSGSGLGLTVVWNAVQDHNGHIFIHSDKNGTVFEVLFPATRQDIPDEQPCVSIEEIRGSGELILVVDDLKEQQDIALIILDSLGYQAKAVDNGQDAVEFIKTQPVRLVILDMIMAPSISGLETYRRIKQINPDQKAIIVSGYSESADVAMTQRLGAGSFIKKPYTVLDLGIAIKEELER